MAIFLAQPLKKRLKQLQMAFPQVILLIGRAMPIPVED